MGWTYRQHYLQCFSEAWCPATASQNTHPGSATWHLYNLHSTDSWICQPRLVWPFKIWLCSSGALPTQCGSHNYWHQPSCRSFTWSPAGTCRSVHIGNTTKCQSCVFFVKRLLTDRLPQHLRNVTNAWLSSPPNLRRSVRRASFILALPKPKKECLRRSPLYMSFCLWNKVMVDFRWSKKELPTRPQLTQYCLDTE